MRRPAVWGQESVLDGPIERSVDRTFERSACWGAGGFYTLSVGPFLSVSDRSIVVRPFGPLLDIS